MDWLRDNLWAVWVGLAALLGLAELASLDFTLLMLAAGALVAAGVSVVVPGLFWLQLVVGLIAAAAMLIAIRPLLVRKLHHNHGQLKTGSAHVVGRSGVVVREISPDGGGSIRLAGELWTAKPFDGHSTIAPGIRVEVMEVDGATAVVYPVADPLDPPPALGGAGS
jgi:membrane protein implicated in regulation of membrane protease activity